MNSFKIFGMVLVACVSVALAACAPTQVQVVSESYVILPRPEMILVYNFAASPEEVQLDQGLSAVVVEAVKGTPRTVEELAVGRATSEALAKELVTEIQKLGLPVQRASGTKPSSGNILEISGQFISIDQGNRTERVVIGLGAGRTDIKAKTQVFDARGGQRKLMAQFETDAKSGYKPGMLETMGAGAAAGHLATSAAASTALAGASETFTATVQADAKRAAKQIAKQLANYFVYQGWIDAAFAN
jgi:hypothetical protein